MLKDRKRSIMAALCCIAFAVCFTGRGKVSASSKETGSETDETHRLPPLPDYDPETSLKFINDSLCIISDPSNSMSPFLQELNWLLNGKDTVINIVHLGDSHIQSGYLSGSAMRLLQSAFGNAGRGWITPLKLSKANEPSDYYISSNVKEWIAGRCIQLKPKCNWSIGGIGIQTASPEVAFNLIIAPNNGAGYSFNRILMYRDSASSPMIPSPKIKDSLALLSYGSRSYEGLLVDTFVTASLVDTFSIKSVGGNARKISNLYYGFMLTNSKPGILYHSIGVNGAKFVDYTDRRYLRHLALLKPSVLIVSLGTNESFGRNFSEKELERQVRLFTELVREELPCTALILTTPAETYKRTYKNKKRIYVRNENMAKIAGVITSFAGQEGIACWDLYSITGGDNSCNNWVEAQLLGSDHIHFNRDGYDRQGALLYKSIVRLYMSNRNFKETVASNNTASAKASREEAQDVE